MTDPTPPRRYPDRNPSSGSNGGGARVPQNARLAELIKKFEVIRLEAVFEALGADLNQDGDKYKVKLPGMGNIIYMADQRWKNVNLDTKGFGGVQLVCHALGFEYRQDPTPALKWMIEKFGEQFGDELKAEDIKIVVNEYAPPEPFTEDLGEVRDYLVDKRGIPGALIDDLIRQSLIYATHPYDKVKEVYWKSATNCVFIGPASAELRGTKPDGFKGCCEGSQTDNSGFSIRPAPAASEKIVALVEAAIDALSYRAMFPGRFTMSTNGSGRFVLMYRVANEAVERGLGVRMATDADWAGDHAAQKIFNAFYARKVLSHKLGVEPEVIDEWLLTAKLIIDPEHSPHENFFNTGWAEQLPVHEARVEGVGENAKTYWEPNGQTAAPVVRVRALQDLHPKLLRGEMALPVSARGFDYIVQDLNIRRDRPQYTKDWNEDMRRLGEAFKLDYDRCSKSDFKDGVPKLPAELESLRVAPPRKAAVSESPKAAPAPASAPAAASSPVAAEAAPEPPPADAAVPAQQASRGRPAFLSTPAPAPSSRPSGFARR